MTEYTVDQWRGMLQTIREIADAYTGDNTQNVQDCVTYFEDMLREAEIEAKVEVTV